MPSSLIIIILKKPSQALPFTGTWILLICLWEIYIKRHFSQLGTAYAQLVISTQCMCFNFSLSLTHAPCVLDFPSLCSLHVQSLIVSPHICLISTSLPPCALGFLTNNMWGRLLGWPSKVTAFLSSWRKHQLLGQVCLRKKTKNPSSFWTHA